MTRRIVDRSRHTASLVVRPTDALRRAMNRPLTEIGPVRPVSFTITGRVVLGNVEPLPGGPPRRVRNLSGDTVFRDLGLQTGTYRLVLSDERGRPLTDGVYENHARDIAWPTFTPGLPPDFPDHPTHLIDVRLAPSSNYPFPAPATLIRGSLVWYDGTALAGALVSAPVPPALVDVSAVNERGNFVLAFHATAATAPVILQLNFADVDPTSRVDGAAYIATLPAVLAAQWNRGETFTVRHPGLTGMVTRPGGFPLAGARVRLAGRPGSVISDATGAWTYHLPPATPAGPVDVHVQHPGYGAVTRSGVPVPADAIAHVPAIEMT